MRKYIYLGLVLLAVAWFAYQADNFAKPNTAEIKSSVTIGSQIIRVEIAEQPAEQIRGLSYRASLCPDCGMLFVFPDRQVRSFWMKDMNFPLDIIWIADDKIAKISYNLPPDGPNPNVTYSSEIPVNYVLEVNAGYAEKYGFKVGDRVDFNL